MMHRICKWLADRLPLRMITCEGEPYLMRFYICGRAPLHYWPNRGKGIKPRLKWLPFAVYLHGFVRHDKDRDLHNHPWDKSYSLILAGGYDEERLGDDGRHFVRRVRPGMVNVIARDDFHRVTKLHSEIVWTLFITGRKLSTWGFRDTETGDFIPWRVYIALREQERSQT